MKRNPTIHELVIYIHREQAFRQRNYQKLILMGRMTQESADYDAACLEEILRILKEQDQPSLPLQ
jgi:hypothetical protein